MKVKICGLTTPETVDAAVAGGADYLGFVFFPPSPRAIDVRTAAELGERVPPGIVKVALVVDAEDDLIDRLIVEAKIDMLQLHGRETPERVATLRSRTGLPVMKAIGVATHEDLREADRYAGVCDQLLIDAKPPRGAVLPGGNGLSFDWRIVKGRRWRLPWILAGGLTADTVTEAARLTGAEQVDVSSGVEAAPGQKDPAKIAEFLAAARSV